MNEWDMLAAAGAAWAALILSVAAAALAATTALRVRSVLGANADDGRSKPRDTNIRIELTDEPRQRRPLKLTDLGRDLVNHMDGPAWVAKKTDRLKHDVRKMEPYEVDLYAQEVLERHGLFKTKTTRMLPASRALHDRVSRAAYECGVGRENVLTALRVLLREELLKTRDDRRPTTETDTGNEGAGPATELTDSA